MNKGKQIKQVRPYFLADSAQLFGNIQCGEYVSIWFQSVLRDEESKIQIGAGTNIQDHCTLHTTKHNPIVIGRNVSVGHRCILHGCTIEDECIIGMGAIIMNGAIIQKHSIIGAGSVVLEHTVIPEHSIVVGNPARVIKQITQSQIEEIKKNALHYQQLAKQYKKKM